MNYLPKENTLEQTIPPGCEGNDKKPVLTERKCKLIKLITLGLVGYHKRYDYCSNPYELNFRNPIRYLYGKLIDYRLHKELPKWQSAISKNDNWWTKGHKFGNNIVSSEVMTVLNQINNKKLQNDLDLHFKAQGDASDNPKVG